VAQPTEETTVVTVEHDLHLAIAGAIFPVAPVARSIDEPTVRVELSLRLVIARNLFLLPQTLKAREVTLISARTIIPQAQARIRGGILLARHKDILGQSRALAGEDVE
jgi:hypothetical protein